MTDERPTLAERYARAAQSSDLKLRDERRGDVDTIIAAGMAACVLGASLLRLRTEFDAVKAELGGQAANNETEQLLILMRLKSLPYAKQRLGTWGVARAAGKGLETPERDVRQLVGRALVAWLDPLCGKCEGRGFNGGYDGPKMMCHPCGNTGRRAQNLGASESERLFAADLLAHMDRMTANVEAQMAALLRG